MARAKSKPAKKPAKKKSTPSVEKPKVNVMTAFPTYILTRQWDNTGELNAALEKEILRKRIKDPEGVYRSNTAGTWHSDTKLLSWSGDAGKQLAKMFGQCFNQYCDVMGGQPGGSYEVQMSAWAMMYQDRGYATCHTHPNCHFAGVYYVRDGEQHDLVMATGVKVRSGELEFVDTRGVGGHQISGLNMNPGARVVPEPGMMVIFPQWLPHFVHPIIGDTERISISCNASIKYKPPQKETE